MTKADFEISVREHQKMVYSIAFNFFHNVALAEEIAQDVFLLLYEKRLGVQPGAHCVAWLRRTAVHRCIDGVRRDSFRNEVQVDRLPELPADAVESDPLLEEHIRKLVRSLPETQRAVVVLRFGEDMDVNDIGEALEMPARTVWSHLQRATELLRQKASRILEERLEKSEGKR